MKGREADYPNHGWIITKLDQEHIDFLWKAVENKKDSVKWDLIGNISGSYAIEDKDHYFFNEVLSQHIEAYKKLYQSEPIRQYAYSKNNDAKLQLGNFWVNYQNKHEFNPYHHHGGVYSFVVWMKIPTHWEDQNKLEFLNGVKEEDKKAGNFEFEYLDILGNIRNFGYRMEPDSEGTMLFFPASLRHTVYPFYDCDEQRITISGNLVISV